MSRLEGLKKHLPKAHPKSVLTEHPDDLRRSTSFYVAFRPRHWNPDTPTRAIPRRLYDNLMPLYQARNIPMPDQHAMHCPANAAEAMRMGLTVPALHPVSRRVPHARPTQVLSNPPPVPAALLAVAGGPLGGTGPGQAPPPATRVTPPTPEEERRTRQAGEDLDRYLQALVDQNTDSLPVLNFGDDLAGLPMFDAVQGASAIPTTSGGGAILALHPSPDDRAQIGGSPSPPARAAAASPPPPPDPHAFRMVEVRLVDGGPLMVRLVYALKGVRTAVYEIAIEVGWDQALADEWTNSGLLFDATGDDKVMLDAYQWVVDVTGAAEDSVTSLLALVMGATQAQILSVRVRSPVHGRADTLADFAFLDRSLPLGNRLRLTFLPLRDLKLHKRARQVNIGQVAAGGLPPPPPPPPSAGGQGLSNPDNSLTESGETSDRRQPSKKARMSSPPASASTVGTPGLPSALAPGQAPTVPQIPVQPVVNPIPVAPAAATVPATLIVAPTPRSVTRAIIRIFMPDGTVLSETEFHCDNAPATNDAV